MLRLNRFDYLAPSSVTDAAVLLLQHGPEAMLMAGGTDLLPNIKHRLCTPALVIGLRHLSELQGVYLDEDGWLAIGAGATLREVESDLLVTDRYPALAYAAQLISTPQVRTV